MGTCPVPRREITLASVRPRGDTRRLAPIFINIVIRVITLSLLYLGRGLSPVGSRVLDDHYNARPNKGTSFVLSLVLVTFFLLPPFYRRACSRRSPALIIRLLQGRGEDPPGTRLEAFAQFWSTFESSRFLSSAFVLDETEVMISRELIPRRGSSTTRFSTAVDRLLGVTARRARLVIDLASAAESDLAPSLHKGGGGGGGWCSLSLAATP